MICTYELHGIVTRIKRFPGRDANEVPMMKARFNEHQNIALRTGTVVPEEEQKARNMQIQTLKSNLLLILIISETGRAYSYFLELRKRCPESSNHGTKSERRAIAMTSHD